MRVNGRYWLIDWKSNRLADSASGYGYAALEAEVARHGYALQFCLYTLALHRWLRQRLPGYDYERDLGGVRYLFLRGVGAVGAPNGCGIYAVRPSGGLIDALDSLLGAHPGSADEH